jgi:hypothetical protein
MAQTDDVVSTEGPISSLQDAQLDALARSEDASSYIAERQAQEAEGQGQEPETPADERQNRIDEALARARQDTAEARKPNALDLDQQYQNVAREYQQQQLAEQQLQQQQVAAQRYYEARGRCMAQAEQLRQANPQLHARITSNLSGAIS